MKKIAVLLIVITITTCDIYSQTVNQQAPVDPFKLYTPSFNTAREQNDIYQEWAIFNTLLGVHKYVRYNPNLKDSIVYERSQGVYWEPWQFEPVDIRKELDAIWFTEVSTALN